MITCNIRGHIYTFTNGEWVNPEFGVYSDEESLPKFCAFCSRKYTNGQDPCIKNLQGVVSGCCGHGDSNSAFLHFKDGRRVAGFDKVVDSKGVLLNKKTLDKI